MIFGFAVSTAARLLASAVHFVDRRPRPALGFAGRHSTLFVSFFNVFGLTLFLVGVFGLVAPWHGVLLRGDFLQ